MPHLSAPVASPLERRVIDPYRLAGVVTASGIQHRVHLHPVTPRPLLALAAPPPPPP
eukprot:CAMPEP_0183805486 /NCGR_PEP_ID=MMETSP0803_2-20130417/37309_1 /TAXON_ID=195967 /ORGANISM="Crustomastix stigmata, Strain CCMP3273" /LENGTH=56 /DNA_ID=CAMNT_0026050243 /DNA_START=131 /DNA_END=298 /DNA_ORIENTATION=-